MRNKTTNHFLLIYLCVITLSSCAEVVKQKELDVKDNLFYKKNDTKPFTGKILESYISGNDSLVAEVDSGSYNDNYLVYYRTGEVKDSVVYKKGEIIKFKRFLTNGSEMKVPEKLLFKSKDGLTCIVDKKKDTIPFSGLSIRYNDGKSSLYETSNYINGELNGVCNSYFHGGKIFYTRKYKYGKLDGKSVEYYANGKFKEEGDWVAGLRVGKWTTYYANKQIDKVGIYKNGNKDSTWNEYYENGKKELISNYLNGVGTGNYIAYFANGNIKAKGRLKNDLREGDWTFYNSNGSVDAQQRFSHGKALRRCDCCGKYYNYDEGWCSRNPGFSRGAWDFFADGGAGGGPYCSKGCARRCE